MPYTLPTVSEFKAQFARDFPYAVPAWGAAATLTLTAGAITAVTLTAGGQGYTFAPDVTITDPTGSGAAVTATVANGRVTGFVIASGGTGYTNPVVSFSGGAGDDSRLDFVTDSDISGAILDAQFNSSQSLFDSQTGFSRAFLYLAAHNLVERLLAAGEGLKSQYNWLTASKAVGSVQESFIVPDRISRDPMLSAYSKTRYGLLYLQIISPLLIGGFFSSHRQTLP